MKIKIDEQGKVAKIRTLILEPMQKGLTDLLQNNYNMMACSPAKMKGVSRNMIVQKLNVKKKPKQ